MNVFSLHESYSRPAANCKNRTLISTLAHNAIVSSSASLHSNPLFKHLYERDFVKLSHREPGTIFKHKKTLFKSTLILENSVPIPLTCF